jgi:hypothetical protein
LTTVVYQLRVPYLRRFNGSLFPGLVVALQNRSTGEQTVEINAELDSGAEYSLFKGEWAVAIGLDLFGGTPFAFGLANGISLDSRILPVVLSHAELGRFELDARFSTGPLRSNILGRDFFDLLQVGLTNITRKFSWEPGLDRRSLEICADTRITKRSQMIEEIPVVSIFRWGN